MRHLGNKLDAVRKGKPQEVKRKFILAFEGYRTEVQYFKGISDNRSKLGISSLIEVCPLNRYPIQSGSSDPGTILDILEEYVEFLDSGKCRLDLFINSFINDTVTERDLPRIRYKAEELIIEVKERLQPLCDGEGVINEMEKAAEICSETYRRIFGVAEEVYFNGPERIDYRKGRDIICVIVDRDADTRGPAECKEFFSRCKKNGFEAYMTNPCFEMWLLLHFDEILYERAEDLLLNKKTGNTRYTEQRLDEIVRSYPANNGYCKTDLDFGCFMHRVDNAIKNEKMFCRDTGRMIKNVGSNIGSLITKMRDRN